MGSFRGWHDRFSSRYGVKRMEIYYVDSAKLIPGRNSFRAESDEKVLEIFEKDYPNHDICYKDTEQGFVTLKERVRSLVEE